eukprot:g1723.t1
MRIHVQKSSPPWADFQADPEMNGVAEECGPAAEADATKKAIKRAVAKALKKATTKHEEELLAQSLAHHKEKSAAVESALRESVQQAAALKMELRSTKTALAAELQSDSNERKAKEFEIRLAQAVKKKQAECDTQKKAALQKLSKAKDAQADASLVAKVNERMAQREKQHEQAVAAAVAMAVDEKENECARQVEEAVRDAVAKCKSGHSVELEAAKARAANEVASNHAKQIESALRSQETRHTAEKKRLEKGATNEATANGKAQVASALKQQAAQAKAQVASALKQQEAKHQATMKAQVASALKQQEAKHQATMKAQVASALKQQEAKHQKALNDLQKKSDDNRKEAQRYRELLGKLNKTVFTERAQMEKLQARNKTLEQKQAELQQQLKTIARQKGGGVRPAPVIKATAPAPAPNARPSGGSDAAVGGVVITREQLRDFYAKYDPSKVARVDALLQKYVHTKMIEALQKKYGDSPLSFPPAAAKQSQPLPPPQQQQGTKRPSQSDGSLPGPGQNLSMQKPNAARKPSGEFSSNKEEAMRKFLARKKSAGR